MKRECEQCGESKPATTIYFAIYGKGLSKMCRECQNYVALTNYHAQADSRSSKFVLRHEAKRRQEAEIARQLSAKPVERAERPYRPFISVTTEAVFGRSPRRFRSAWRAA